MATVGVHSLKITAQDAIEYILQKDKTENALCGAYHCSIKSAGITWQLENTNGMKREKGEVWDSIAGYHFRISFPPESITHEESHTIAEKWIQKITNGNHAYVIATHTDKSHVHTHIIVNPKNERTGKSMDIFYKRDVPLFKYLADQVCIEHGKEVLLSQQGKGTTYYEWLQKNKGDSYKDIIKKSCDAVIPLVKDFNEFVAYLEKLGFEVEYQTKNPEILSEYKCSMDQVLVKEREGHHTIYRIPRTSYYIRLNDDEVELSSNGKTTFWKFDTNRQFEIIRKDRTKFMMDGKELAHYYDDKGKEGRSGLRIKIPNGKKFIRCDRIDEYYSLENVIKRIQENGNFITSPEVHEFLNSDSKKKYQDFYEENGIRLSYRKSYFHRMSSYEKYVFVRMKNVESMLQELRALRSETNDILNFDSLVEKRDELQKELVSIKDLLKDKEHDLYELKRGQIDETIDATDSDVEEFINNKIIPLRESKMTISKEIKSLNERIKVVENKSKKNTLKKEK